MGIETYYVGKEKLGKFGKMFFLKQLQELDATGGGRALLGSVVPEINRKFSPDYPIPQSLIDPQVFIKVLEKRKQELKIDGNVTLKASIAPGTETLKLEKKMTFQAGIGPFPFIPLNLGLDIDYEKMATITMTYGKDTYYEYIPLGFVARLNQAERGTAPETLGGRMLEDNAFISQMLFAKNYIVEFESHEKFTSGFDLKLDAYNVIPAIKGKVSLSRSSDRTVKAEVKSDTYYAVALASTNWEDTDMT